MWWLKNCTGFSLGVVNFLSRSLYGAVVWICDQSSIGSTPGFICCWAVEHSIKALSVSHSAPAEGSGKGHRGQLLSSDQTNISCLLAWCLAAKPVTTISKATSATQGLAGYQHGGGWFPLHHSEWVKFFAPLKSQLTLKFSFVLLFQFFSLSSWDKRADVGLTPGWSWISMIMKVAILL